MQNSSLYIDCCWVINPITVSIDNSTFLIGRMPALTALDFFENYQSKGSYIPAINEDIINIMMSFVYFIDFVENEENYKRLNTTSKINKYVDSAEVLLELEKHIIKHNTDFLNGRKEVKLYRKFNSAKYNYQNVNSGLAALIAEKLANLHDLRTIYDYEDMLNMLEVIQVNKSNEAHAIDEAKKSQK